MTVLRMSRQLTIQLLTLSNHKLKVRQESLPHIYAGVLELADEVDSKSIDGNIVRVQVPPPAPIYKPFSLIFVKMAFFIL